MKPWLVVSYYFMEYNQLLSLDLPPGSVDKAGQVPSYSEVCLGECWKQSCEEIAISKAARRHSHTEPINEKCQRDVLLENNNYIY